MVILIFAVLLVPLVVVKWLELSVGCAAAGSKPGIQLGSPAAICKQPVALASALVQQWPPVHTGSVSVEHQTCPG